MADEENAVQRGLAGITQIGNIPFVQFTTDLVRGVYQVVLDGAMDQLKAYADFVAQIGGTLADYQAEVAGGSPAEQKARAEQYAKNVLELKAPANATSLADPYVPPDQTTWEKLLDQLPDSIKTTPPSDFTPGAGESAASASLEDVYGTTLPTGVDLDFLLALITARLQADSSATYSLLTTILQMGMQRIVVSEGKISTKLTFSVIADDTYEKSAQTIDTKSTSWGITGRIDGNYSGKAGQHAKKARANFVGGWIQGGYNSGALHVNVVNEKSTAATNVRAEVVGAVEISFRTETFPPPALK